jgi:bifunctional non-homologous end joining protein LigD
LTSLIRRAGDDRLRLSESFDDGELLLAAAAKRGLEGIVSKRTDSPYRAGASCGWIKVKTQTWRQANRERYKIFERA